HQLSDESLRCSYPTWSPNNAYIAYVATDNGEHSSIYANATDGGERARLVSIDGYRTIYFNWSPDSRLLALLYRNETSRWGQVVPLDAVKNAFSFEFKRNLFWQWSHNGKYILWNRDGDVSVTAISSPSAHVDPEQRGSRFRAPAWTSSGENFIFTDKQKGHVELVEFIGTSKDPKHVYSTSAQCSIVVSPNYSQIAILDYRRGGFGILNIVIRDQEKELRLTRVRAVFWSPDSRYLALWTIRAFAPNNKSCLPVDRYTTLTHATTQNPNTNHWWLYDTKTGSMQPLVSFMPTKACIDIAWDFSQYHTSHSFWSPDSRYFLVPSINPESNEPHVWKVDILGQEAALDLGEGTFATWSWQ
ncbi:MAG: hypothetical protein L3K26_07560, partial [Candidatus Hydrogenedentes bacterium]|nr:hypothetical protein [Candidatus Hydrogenedentota bacterium]